MPTDLLHVATPVGAIQPASHARISEGEVNTKVEESSNWSAAEVIKLGIALALVAAGVWGYQSLANEAQWIRVLVVLGTFGAAAGVAAFSERGGKLFKFMQGSRMELRKVVWPTREETVQTTIVVVIFVIIMSIILFLFDTILSRIISWLVGG